MASKLIEIAKKRNKVNMELKLKAKLENKK